MNRLDPSNIRQPFGRVYPFADRPATPTHQVFPAFRPADAPNARRPATAPGRVITQLRGRGTVVATRPHTRRGLRQKDGFDLDLTRSSVEQFTQLSSFRASVVSRIRRANGRSLDATTGPAAEARRRREEAARATAKAALSTAQEHENWLLDGVLSRLRIATERALLSGRYGADLRYFEGTEKISIPQFRAALRGAFNIELKRKELELLVKHFDHDGDGELDYWEVKAALMTPSRGLVLRMDRDARDKEHPFARVMAKFRAVAAAPAPGESDAAPGGPEEGALAKQRARRKRRRARQAAERARGKSPAPRTAKELAAEQKELSGRASAFSLRKVFELADANGDGHIDEGELTECLRRFGLELSDAECAAVFGVLDPEGDGSIRFEELVWVYYNQKLAAEHHAPLSSHHPTRVVAPWVPNAASVSSREAVSEDRRHAYVNATAPFREQHHDALLAASHADARALRVHGGEAFRGLGATNYRLRAGLYGTDNFLGAPRAGATPLGGGTRNAREHGLPARGCFGPTTFFRGRRPAPTTPAPRESEERE
jgi:Ca2+-binding EF-hand superfamily protein